MRSNNGKEDQYKKYLEQKHLQFAVDRQVIENIVQKATGKKPEEIERIIAGEVNEVYLVRVENSSVMVRISREAGDRLFSEKWAIDKVREVGVPAPEVFLVDEFEDKGNKIWASVENKLKGKPLDKMISAGELSEEAIKPGKLLCFDH